MRSIKIVLAFVLWFPGPPLLACRNPQAGSQILQPVSTGPRGPVYEIDVPTTIDGELKLLGPAVIRFSKGGRLLLPSQTSKLVLRDCEIEWMVSDEVPAEISMIGAVSGGVSLESCLVRVKGIHQPQADRAKDETPLRHLVSIHGDAKCHLSDVRVLVALDLRVLFLYAFESSEHIEISRVDLDGCSGGIYLSKFSTGRVRDVKLRNCDMAAIAAFEGKELDVSGIDCFGLGRRGKDRGVANATLTGDGVTLDRVQKVVLRESRFVDGGCYGVQILGGAIDFEARDCEFLGGITHGIYAPGASEASLRTRRFFRLRHCLFRGNAGAACYLKDFGVVELLSCRGENNYSWGAGLSVPPEERAKQFHVLGADSVARLGTQGVAED